MSLGMSPLSRRTAGLAIPTPVYADTNDSPIDLRKKVAIRRSKYGYDHGNHQYHSDCSSSDEEDSHARRRVQSPLSVDSGLWTKKVLMDRASHHHHHHQAAFPTVPNPYHVFSLRNLHPVLSEQYGIQYALFASPEGTHVVPVPTHYSSAQLPHLRASLTTPPCVTKRDYYATDQRHPKDEGDEVRRNVYYREQEHHKPLKPTQEAEFRIRDSPPENHYPWRKVQNSSAFADTEVIEKRQLIDKCQSNENFYGSRENCHLNGRNTSSPQDRQPRQRLKTADRPPLQRRARSLSLSHLRKARSRATSKYSIHPGYSSDSESSNRSKISSLSLSAAFSRTNEHSSPAINKRRKVVNGSSIDGSGSDSDSTTRLPKTDKTLLNLLTADTPNPSKRCSEVLLRQLQRSPVNHSVGKEGYPWSVYEYYNHLVERFRDRPFQRSPTHFQPYNSSCSPPITNPSMLISGLPTDEDSIGNHQRKRPTRALTGKHVKHGTGASPSTLITLRQKIQERQRAKELRVMGIDQHPHEDSSIKTGRNVNYKKPKQVGNLKRLKPGQNGNPSLTTNVCS